MHGIVARPSNHQVFRRPLHGPPCKPRSVVSSKGFAAIGRGLWEPDEGEIVWEGKPVRIHSPKEADALGITTIYQDLALCGNLDVVQNMFLGQSVAVTGR